MRPFGPINLVVIQPTTFCNLDCDYCYLPERHLRKQLDLALIEPIFRAVFTSPYVGEAFTICWHAGEPLAAPIAFYRAAFEAIEAAARLHNKGNAQFVHSIQTNATLITQAWCDLFIEFGVQVGVSVDGPAFLHDAHRKTRAGTGSFEATMRGISLLQRNGIPFQVIAVVSDASLDYPDEVFAFFRELDVVELGFNMEETEGVNLASSLDGERNVEARYRRFMQRMWDLIAESGGALKLREFETIAGLIYFQQRLEQTDMNAPFAIVNFDNRGNFSTFDPELLSVHTERYGDFVFGNVLHDSLESICSTEKFERAYRDMQAGVERCRSTCDYFGVCGGGAGSNKYWENGTFDSSETRACRYRTQVVTDIVAGALEKSLA